MINKNPFSVNRAEYMKNLWKYYVPFKDFPDNVDKSVVVVGGRGTGKSMFFLCNSWREKYSALEISSNTPVNDFLSQGQIGIYYKVDSTFVGAMHGNSANDRIWDGYFNTYLSICLFVELLPLIRLLFENGILELDDLNNITSTYYQCVRGKAVRCASIDQVDDDCHAVLQEIEDLINCISETTPTFRPTQPGTILKAIINELHSISGLSEIVFKVYIDEYESFSERQQKIINTLIKQSSCLLIYNIGMRHNGMKTQCTLGENEILQPTHDYYTFNFDDLLTEKDYENVLRNICKKRFELFFHNVGLTSNTPSTDIEFYLSRYNINKELEHFEGRSFKFKERLEKIIQEQSTEDDDVALMIDTLCHNAPVLNSRLHLALLLRAPQYRPAIKQLYSAYIAWQSSASNGLAAKYKEWLHNAKNGIIYLLAKDVGITKWYYGFDTYAALSSGVVRYFLELCEQAFNIATMEGFSWENPCTIPCEIQTRAAKYVSQYKVNEISSYPSCGKRLRIFVQCFGEICRDLTRNDNSTLGEPEINHFTTESLHLSNDIELCLSDAVTWQVLQKLPQTKSKEGIRTSILDYHLNKIYTPYFEISYNKKRKITLNQEQLEQLFSSDINIANRAAYAFLDKYWCSKQLKHSMSEAEGTEQINLFEPANKKSSP